jgi:hypothetical protein
MATRAGKRYCGSRRLLATLVVTFPATLVVLTVVLVHGSRAANSALGITFRLDHFQCYQVDPGGTFQPRTVNLVDQFGRSRARVAQMTTLCAPARKNKTPVRNRLAHLACYPIRSTPAFRPRRVIVTNQFEKATRVVVARPNQLCVPSGKALPPTRPRPVKGLDHYQCYLAKPAKALAPRRVVLVDQFGKSRPTVVRMVSFCAPVRKNKVVVKNARDHLACYQLRPAGPFQPRRVLIVNQFGNAQLTVVVPQTLCLPSRKRVVPTLPDLTVTIPNTRTDVSCPGGAGTCITTRTFTITNPSSVNVATPLDVLAQADPGQSKTITIPGLAAGASLALTQQWGPAGNCYDPDCTVTFTVDSGNAVAESNEANNTATRTDLG